MILLEFNLADIVQYVVELFSILWTNVINHKSNQKFVDILNSPQTLAVWQLLQLWAKTNSGILGLQ